MTTHRDLAEAAAFHRRRLVRAFQSGSADAPPTEQPSPVRCILGGLVLTAVCVAGAGVSSRASGHPDVSWDGGSVHLSP